MLQNLRDNSRGVISFILIGFLVIIFALTGVEALFNWDTSANQAAKVNGETITEMDVNRAIGMQKQQMLNAYGDQIPAQFLSDEYLRKPAIDNLVQRLILSQAAKEAGMAVGETYLAQQIATAPQFKNEAGVFDNNVYQALLRNLGYTHSTYTKILSDELLINQLQAGVAESAFSTPAQLDDIVALSFQSRDIQYVILPSAKVRDSIELQDSEVQSYYDANQPMFVSEEQIAVDYISLSVQDLMANVSISEEQLRAQYEQNSAAFVAAPERQAAHILIEGNDADKIKQVSEKLASGVEFAAVASEFSDDSGSKDQGGDLGFTSGDAFPQEFETALASLKVGEVSGPVKTDAGTHFIKLLAEKNSTPPSFEEQKAAIEEQLKRAEAEVNFVAQLEKLRDLSYNAENLAEVAKELGLKVENSGLYERSKGKGLLASPKVTEAAFSDEVLREGNSSEVIEIDSSNVLVLKMTEHKPSQVKPLAEVKEQIVNTLKDQKARVLLSEQSNKFIADLNAGSTLADLSVAAGLESKEFKEATRNTADADGDVLRHAFSMSKPAAGKPSVGNVMTSGGDMAIVVVQSVSPGSFEKVTPEQKTTISAQLASIYGRNDFSGFQKFLKDSADIVQK
ncbi:SurA N-terminal domain-containing protein [Cellvibrio sp. PSBB023]|uniref:SurA N-terminal domain-containing protein n=1 Tax=Cellvibrio sp. PSBB023 TaxID=1945512 RepID=UPI00098F6B62|nr:SurA N-terminal domain-containing protein [Cellvibrio sp. PSBB023]AQT59429.1 peptidylprolyl isomerase [Cellvibrio sp. PSBB023]